MTYFQTTELYYDRSYTYLWVLLFGTHKYWDLLIFHLINYDFFIQLWIRRDYVTKSIIGCCRQLFPFPEPKVMLQCSAGMSVLFLTTVEFIQFLLLSTLLPSQHPEQKMALFIAQVTILQLYKHRTCQSWIYVFLSKFFIWEIKVI